MKTLTVAQLKAELGRSGVTFGSKMLKPDLVALLEKHISADNEENNVASTSVERSSVDCQRYDSNSNNIDSSVEYKDETAKKKIRLANMIGIGENEEEEEEEEDEEISLPDPSNVKKKFHSGVKLEPDIELKREDGEKKSKVTNGEDLIGVDDDADATRANITRDDVQVGAVLGERSADFMNEEDESSDVRISNLSHTLKCLFINSHCE